MMKRWLKLSLVILLLALQGLSYAEDERQPLPHFVSGLDWSSDGTTVAVGYSADIKQPCQNSSIDLLNVTGMTPVISAQFPESCGINSLDLGETPQGWMLLAARNSALLAWEVSTGNLLFNRLEFTFIEDVSWDHNASRFLAIDYTRTAIRDVQGSITTQLSKLDLNTSASFTSGDWSPDSTRIVNGFSDNTLRIWDVADLTVQVTFSQHEAPVTTVDWNPTSDLIASADSSGTIMIWNGLTGEVVTSIAGHVGAVNDLVWSPDGRMLASAGDDGYVYIWRVQKSFFYPQSVLRQLTSFEYQAAVYAAAWSPDGTQIAYGGQGTEGHDGQVEISPVAVGV